MDHYTYSNCEKIRLLFIELQRAILKDKKFQELKYTDEYLCFDLYKVHLETLISMPDNSLFDYMSFQFFD